MKPPGFAEKEALSFIDSLAITEQVSECGNVRTLRMAALLGLFQLLRVTQQNKTASSLRTHQYISQRHLACLIDKEDVHRIRKIPTRSLARNRNASFI
jgi:hypothetical protein